MTPSSLTVRHATAGDAPALSLLARLDEDAPLTAPVLLAEDGDRPLAALSLCDGRAVADPFAPTAPVVELLRLRAAQLQRAA